MGLNISFIKTIVSMGFGGFSPSPISEMPMWLEIDKMGMHLFIKKP
jgi:hypothetical protein